MASPISPQVAATVRQRIAALAARRRVAGAQYVVVREGEVWLEHCLGLADVALARPVTHRTTFNAYSITKPFSAAAAIALAEEGRLDLDMPIGIAAGVEGLEAYGSVRETLLHRAGFRNPFPLRWIHLDELHDSFDGDEFARAQVARLRGSTRRMAPSGYSNLGYLLLGMAISRAWGGPYEQAVRSLILDPLHLRPEERLGFVIDAPKLHAHGHLRRHGLVDLMLGLVIDRSKIVQCVEDGWVQLRLHHVNGAAYGGLMANARGLARFGWAVIGSGAGMAPRVRRSLLEVVPGPGPRRSPGWYSGSLGRHAWLAHAGGGVGGYGELRLYPELGAASVLLLNGPGFADSRCLDGIDAAWGETVPGSCGAT